MRKSCRVYACAAPDGTLVVCCAYQAMKTSRGTAGASNQGPAIETFRRIIRQLPDDLTSIPYEQA